MRGRRRAQGPENAAKYNPSTLALTIGSRIGPYEILSSLGAGGMGEVYRARDSKLQRDVAIKVLPELFAADPDRVKRFEREAQTLASLNHPHIAQVHGVHDAPLAVVMELVEGEDLRQRLERGPVPVDEAIDFGRQIAEALEAAHELGIIHRDLKPANIKLRPDGIVKVLDFGLAKVVEPTASGVSDMNSPTLTARGTEIGMILGTAAYMAPEQARGKAVDRRADIWAFGCVLYELLTGQQAFGGDSVTDIFAAVVHLEPDSSALPSSTPASVRTLLRRCLEKDSKRRLRDIGEARLLLEDPNAATAQLTALASVRSSRAPWMLAAAATLVAAIALAWPTLRPAAATPRDILRADIATPDGTIPEAVAISPNGRQLAILARSAATERRLYRRSLDRFEAEEVASTRTDVVLPFYSPDSAWIAYFSAGKLFKVPAAGGVPTAIADTPAFSGVWLEDGRIILGEADKLTVVSENGGAPQPLAGMTADRWAIVSDYDATHRSLFYIDYGANRTMVQRLGQSRLEGDPKVLLEYATLLRSLPDGYLVFRERGAGPRRLLIQRYDPESLALIGAAVPVEGGSEKAIAGVAGFDVSPTGTLVYERGWGSGTRRLVWVSRTGAVTPVEGPAANYFDPVISDDGRYIACVIDESTAGHVWVQDVKSGARNRVTFEEVRHMGTSWRPAHGEVAYVKGFAGAFAATPATGGGNESLFGALPMLGFGTSWTPDGKRLAVMKLDPVTGWDVVVVDADASKGQALPTVEPIAVSNNSEVRAVFSPNGRFLAYGSNESGRMEIYVHTYPVAGRPWQVSTGGGDEPRWSRDGKELFFRQGTRMMAVTVDISGRFAFAAPRVLFEGDFDDVGGITDYDVAPDGRFLMLKPEVRVDRPGLALIVNWFEDFRRSLK
jgi:serine/threonine protein kinase/Tol biopolymer transport system component